MHSFMSTILLWATWICENGCDSLIYKPVTYLGISFWRTNTSKRSTIVSVHESWQSIYPKNLYICLLYRLKIRMIVTSYIKYDSTIGITSSKWITISFVVNSKFAFIVSAPNLIWTRWIKYRILFSFFC